MEELYLYTPISRYIRGKVIHKELTEYNYIISNMYLPYSMTLLQYKRLKARPILTESDLNRARDNDLVNMSTS